MLTREQIVAAARSYIGVRYRHQGRNRLGVDCIGLVVLVGRSCGIEVRDVGGYARRGDGDVLVSQLESQCLRLARGAQQAGDILLLDFGSGPQHIAIMTDAGMVHAYAGARRVVEHRIDEMWAARIVAAYAFRGVEA